MAISTKVEYASIVNDELCLDPTNPRLGRSNTGRDVSQERVLELMKNWTLDELAVSFLENGGFWTHEAVLVVEEELYGETCLVVVEGNRRLAALKYLYDAYEGRPVSRKWKEIASSAQPSEGLFTEVPYLKADTRDEISGFLGFRHVTGIKEWKPAEKAGFISMLIDKEGLTYKQVMRKIGSKTPTVRGLYITYRMALQIDDWVEEVSQEDVQKRFSVMYLSLRTSGVQKYLQVNTDAEPEEAKRPVPKTHKDKLSKFAVWLFGNENNPPLFTDSRMVDNFGIILESDEAVEYLERSEPPRFDIAFKMAGGEEIEVVRFIERAADDLELALTTAHLHKKSEKVQKAVRRLGAHAVQLLDIFPSIRAELEEDE